MKKRILTLIAGLCTAFLLCSCNVEGHPLPEGMDETTVLSAGREIVADLNAGNWQSIYDRMREDAKTSTGSPDAIAVYTRAVLDEVGPYVSEEDFLATGQELDSGEQYATAVFYCDHEDDQAMYRIAFSTDMELLGLEIAEK